MKIAALYDIHGNLPALQAVLAELEEIQPDLIVIGGDILSGPMPVQTLERLLQLTIPVHFIRGNCDREVALAYDGIPLRSGMSEKGREVTEWVANQLTSRHRDFLESLPLQFTQVVDGIGNVLFCHATPYSDEALFTPKTNQQQLGEMFENVHHDTVICGHTHIQFDVKVDDLLILNAGSVGMPYAEEPGAYWLLLGPEGYEFRKTQYDWKAAAEAIEQTLYPQAKEFARENVLTVPTADQAIEVFEKLRNR